MVRNGGATSAYVWLGKNESVAWMVKLLGLENRFFFRIKTSETEKLRTCQVPKKPQKDPQFLFQPSIFRCENLIVSRFRESPLFLADTGVPPWIAKCDTKKGEFRIAKFVVSLPLLKLRERGDWYKWGAKTKVSKIYIKFDLVVSDASKLIMCSGLWRNNRNWCI